MVSFEEDSKTYQLVKFRKTNQGTSINLKPIVRKGDKVKKGQVLCEGYATENGELALGRNLTVAFMPWKGYNFEDAIVISEKVVREDIFTSIHVDEYSLEVRDTKLGAEELTHDIPNVSEEATKDLDENGMIRIGAEVKPGDILIGKITPKGESDPTRLTRAARKHLRDQFLSADAAMTGVNMAIADLGAVVVCTNEGNADMGANLPKLQIHSMGIDKIVPDAESAMVLLRMLARNAIGQPITTYSSFYRGSKADGEMHIIIVDNGRTDIMQDKILAESLKCIRCGGCLNTCPVYRRSGGFSYNYTIPGPIGIAVGAQHDESNTIPWACTLCGSCSYVCPTKVPLDKIIAHHRRLKAEQGKLPFGKKYYMPAVGKLMSSPTLLNCAMGSARLALKVIPHSLIKPFSGAWGQYRELPVSPKSSFDTWYKQHKASNKEAK